MFKIREFSRFTRISVKMLRHYDELGLLKPVTIDPTNNYRYYSSDQLPRLNRIIALKDLGFSLEQVGRLLDENLSPAEIRGMYRMRRVEIEHHLKLEQARLSQVQSRLSFLEQDAMHLNYDVVVREVSPLLVASIRQKISNSNGQVQKLFEELEAYVAHHQARAYNSPLAIYHDDEYHEDSLDIEVAVPIKSRIPTTEKVRVREILGVPAMACVVYTGSYDRTEEVLNALMIWIEANGYRSAGPMREVYLRFGADSPVADVLPPAFLAEKSQLYVTEIQLPIEKLTGSDTRRIQMTTETSQSGLSQIGQVLLPVKDLKRAVAFYRDMLGMKFLFDIADAAFFDCDGIRLMLGLPETPEFDHPGSVLYYRVKDIQSAYELFVSRGVQVVIQPHLVARMDSYDLWMAFFKDTEGNTLALMSEVSHPGE